MVLIPSLISNSFSLFPDIWRRFQALQQQLVSPSYSYPTASQDLWKNWRIYLFFSLPFNFSPWSAEVAKTTKAHFLLCFTFLFFFFFFFFFFFLINSRSALLAGIRWNICISKSQWILCVSCSWAGSDLCIYYFVV